MPSGGARKGAGRKPKPLAEKLAAGNPGHRPLKKVEFTGTGGVDPHEPPAYLRVMEKREQENRPGIPTPTELYTDTVKYLEPSGCLNLVPAALIADYAMAKYYLLHAQYELGKTATVVKIKKGLKKEPAETYEITDFAKAMLKMQKNVLATWEPIGYGWLDDEKRLYPLQDRQQSDLWQISRPQKSEKHPTMKPIALAGRAIMNSSHTGDVTLDLFGGSGTTLLAAEQSDRVNCSMELDPKYCDVIVKRYIKFLESDESVFLLRGGEKLAYNEIEG
jgi:hypothetical protein